jgi:ATP-dependent DNA helicase RecG
VNLNDLLLEGSSVDYKEALETKKPRSWLKSISAFANSFGGHIVFGVRDNPREVCGLDNPQEVISKITELIKARIDPTPRYQLHAFAEDDKICIDLEIQNLPIRIITVSRVSASLTSAMVISRRKSPVSS